MNACVLSREFLSVSFAVYPCPSTATISRGDRSFSCSPFASLSPLRRRNERYRFVVCMAPEEEKMTRRSPVDFPIEWERPKPGRRPDIFPKFSPMKTPLPIPLPADPPLEDEEEEEEEEEKRKKEEDPEKEDTDKS